MFTAAVLMVTTCPDTEKSRSRTFLHSYFLELIVVPRYNESHICCFIKLKSINGGGSMVRGYITSLVEA